LTVEQEVGGSSPPNCTSSIRQLRPLSSEIGVSVVGYALPNPIASSRESAKTLPRLSDLDELRQICRDGLGLKKSKVIPRARFHKIRRRQRAMILPASCCRLFAGRSR
jgi:hypothetical protein